MGKFAGFFRRFESEVLYCRNPRRDGRRRNASATCDSPPFDARFRSSRRSTSPRPFAVGKRDFRFLTRASPRLSRLADCFASTDGGRSQRRFVGSIRDIPLFRTALGSTFRPRSAEERPIRRADGPTAEARFSPQASSFENVEKRLKRGKGACNSRRQGDLRNECENGRRLDFDATTRETLVPQVASRRGVKRSGCREGTRENRFV